MKVPQGQSSLTLRTREEEGPALSNTAAMGPARAYLPPDPAPCFSIQACQNTRSCSEPPFPLCSRSRLGPGSLHFPIGILRGCCWLENHLPDHQLTSLFCLGGTLQEDLPLSIHGLLGPQPLGNSMARRQASTSPSPRSFPAWLKTCQALLGPIFPAPRISGHCISLSNQNPTPSLPPLSSEIPSGSFPGHPTYFSLFPSRMPPAFVINPTLFHT